MTLITTGFPPSVRALKPVREPDPNRVIVSTEWETIAEWPTDPPTTIDDWHVSTVVDVGGDIGVTGEIRLRVSDGALSGFVAVAPPRTRVLIDWTKVPTDAQRVFLDVRRLTGSGGLRVFSANGLLFSGPPGYVAPPTGGGGSEPLIAPTIRGAYAPDGPTASSTTHTILPSDITPAPQPGDKVLLLGAAKGPQEEATHVWNFPGTTLFEGVAPSGFRPRIIGTIVDYNGGNTGWVVSADLVFRTAAVALADAGNITAGAIVYDFTPADPPGLANSEASLGLTYTALNFTQANITAPPTGHTTVLSTQTDIRSRHVHSLALPTAGTYDPDAATAGPGSENASAVAIVIAPTGATGTTTIDPPTIPAFNTGSAITLSNLTADIAALVTAEPSGTHFQLIAGTYTNWEDVRPKQGMHFRGPATGKAVLEGNGLGYCFRALLDTSFVGLSDDVTIGRNLCIQNYGQSTSRFDYAAIQPHATDTLANQYTFGSANNWFLYDIELSANSASGIRMSDNCTVYDCLSYGHTVTGLHAHRNVGGLLHTVTLEANGFNAATGVFSNGGNCKVVWHNAAEGRTDNLPNAAERAISALNVVNCTFNATRAGITGTAKTGFWADLDCQLVNVQGSSFDSFVNHALYFEGSNNCTAKSNAVTNCNGFGDAFNDDFIGGAINIAESTNCTVDGNTLTNCERALVNRMSNRTADWMSGNSAGGVDYGNPSGPRFWLDSASPTPVPGIGDRSNVWTGENTFVDNVLVNCGRVVLNEGTNSGGQNAQGSTPIETIRFVSNDYSGSGSIQFYDRSNSPLTLGQWRQLSFARDQI